MAAFGIVRGFLFLLAGPMRNLQQAYLTLVRHAADSEVLVRFFVRVGSGMALIMLLIAWPLNQVLLSKIIGLDDGMRDYLVWPITACALFPIFYGASNLLRGWFAGAHLTARLGRSTFYKTLLVLVCWPPFVVLQLPLPGIAVAIALLLVAELFEAGYLYRQRGQLLAKRGLVPLGTDSVN